MAVTITAVSLVGGSPPTQVHITGTYSNCEKIDIWVSCNQGNPGRQLLYSAASPFAIDVDLPKTCACGDTIWVWADCPQGSGLPSVAAANTSLTFDCDPCCPQVSIDTPVVSNVGGVATYNFELTTPVTWSPAGCSPPVTMGGYWWTVKQGVAVYQLHTTAANASTGAGNWTIGTTPTSPSAVVPLSLASGSWDVKVRLDLSMGSLDGSCDSSDSTSFTVSGTPPPPKQCCPSDPKSAPYGASVTVAVSGSIPNVNATFTAAVHWPKKCPVVTPANYLWAVTDPSGKQFSRKTTANITYSNDPGADWTLNGVQIGALPFNNGGGYTVVCTVVFPPNTTASGCSTFGSAPFTVAGMQPPPTPTCCPTVNLSAVITGTTGSFSTTTAWPAGCANVVPTSFAWTVTDKSTNTTFVKTTTTSATDQTGFTPPLTLTPSDNYDVSVTPAYPGVTLPQGCSPTGMSSFQAPGSTTTPPPPSGSSSGFSICALLLVLSIVLLLLGGIVFVIGWCIAVIWVWIVGAAIAVVGLVLFIIWAFLCAKQTPCTLMWTMECILDWIVKTAWIVALIAFIFGGLPCGLASFSAWGGWAILDSVLRTVMFRAGCPPIDCTKPRP
jgi:hypothetical protein